MRIARYLLPLVAAVSVFGVATAFAAALTVNSKTLGSGNAGVSSCNTTAAVSYNTAYDSALPGYEVTTTRVTTAVGCANKSYKVTLTGAANASLAERTGSLDASGNVTPDFATSNVAAADVTGVSVVITG